MTFSHQTCFPAESNRYIIGFNHKSRSNYLSDLVSVSVSCASGEYGEKEDG